MKLNKIKRCVRYPKRIGGRKRQLRVVLDKDKLAESAWIFCLFAQMIKANNHSFKWSNVPNKNDQIYGNVTGRFLETQRMWKLGSGNTTERPNLFKTNASIQDGQEIPKEYVFP